jgi:anti-sigma regulatory factor (Ser/Thr protein kinase)/ActR/RegA family two-component response regulator
MKRILIIGDDPAVSGLRLSPHLEAYTIEIADGDADAMQQLRQRAFEVVLTDPQSTIKEDLALVNEMEAIRPGLKTIILAPETTPEDVIAALKARVFACFSSPINVADVAAMTVQALQADQWRDCIEVLGAATNWMAMRVNCQLLTADRLLRFMTEFRSDLEDSDRCALLTAFREMLMNAMEHGAGFNPEKVIEVAAIRTRRAIVYYFRDHGPGFQTSQMRHAAINNPRGEPLAHMEVRETKGMRPGGFGILLAQQLVDELFFNASGNEVMLIKHTA